jgi:hypothetical protein
MAKKRVRSGKRFLFSELGNADLLVDAIYEGGESGNLSAEVISKLIPKMGNAGGFRYVGDAESTPLVVLYSSGSNPDWPDYLDEHSGLYHYYGDNRTPGVKVLEKKGNRVLHQAFAKRHGQSSDRALAPIFLIFESIGEGHSVRFRGLAVPGSNQMQGDEDLITIWRAKNGVRFQNYKAVFTVLNEVEINGDWIRKIASERKLDLQDLRTPSAIKQWVESATYNPLITERPDNPVMSHRNTDSQHSSKSLLQRFGSLFRFWS